MQTPVSCRNQTPKVVKLTKTKVTKINFRKSTKRTNSKKNNFTLEIPETVSTKNKQLTGTKRKVAKSRTILQKRILWINISLIP